MAVQSNDIERVLRMVPKHSKDLFLKELKKHASKIAN
jgi:hypothetical protein